MQTNKKQALRAKTGNTGKTGSTGSTRTTGNAGKRAFTPEQLAAKRRRDAEYRNKKRAIKLAAGIRMPAPEAGAAVPPRAAGANDVFSIIGRLVVRDLVRGGLPCPTRAAEEVEPGVLQQEVELPNGMRAKVTLVDVDRVDPLSERSSLPAPIRLQLLRRRIAQEVSDIVDSHLELS